MSCSSQLTHGAATTRKTMGQAVAALLPPILTICLVDFHGAGLITICVITTVLCQMWVNYRQNRKYWDNSAVVTGLTLALLLPWNCPPWAGIVGGAVAIFGAKTLFGGLGKNWLNPACAGRICLLAVPGLGGEPLVNAQGTFLWGYVSGGLGEFSSVVFGAGALFLVIKGLAKWQIFVPYLVGSGLTALYLGLNPLAVLAWGGTIFGAFFLTSDPVTSPVDCRWRPVYGLFAGFFATAFACRFSALGGVALGILLANLLGRIVDFLSDCG